MRSFEGQRSDAQPVKRTPQEKQKLLRELKETLAGMKKGDASYPTISARIRELDAELSGRAAPSAAPGPAR